MDQTAAKKCKDLLCEYRKRYDMGELPAGELLYFDVHGDIRKITAPFKDGACINGEMIAANITIYNPTKPIHHHGRHYLLGRVEPLVSEKSKVMFFEEIDDKWKVMDNTPVFDLQDPFHIENVQEYHVLGGVEIKEDPDVPGAISYHTLFYRYKESVLELVKKDGKLIEPFAKSPAMMKDIRLIELQNGNIGVFTRPQNGEAGLGKIAYIEIKNLDELERLIHKARIIPNQFHEDEWGGVNELHLLKNGKIGVLGHIAHRDGDIRHYYAMSFVFDPENHTSSHIEILTTADEFPLVKPKRASMGKIVFSGGLHRLPHGKAILYVGVGDTHAGRIKIHDPFWGYELLN